MKQTFSLHLSPVRVFCALAVSFFIFGCGAGEETGLPVAADQQDERVPVIFDVDEELLGEAIDLEDVGLRFQPPYGWFIMGDQQADSLVAAMEPLLDPGFSFSMHGLYFEGESNTILLVAEPEPLSENSDVSAEAAHRLQQYAEYYQEQFEVRELRTDRFSHGEFELDQLVLVEPTVVVARYRLAHSEHPEVELIFVVPSQSFGDMIPVLESVVGSAAPL